MTTYTVYAMTNTDDTHIYVGCTKNYKGRCLSHMRHCLKNKHHSHKVQALYNQIGPDGFEFDVLEEHDTKDDARVAEQKWVDYYKTSQEWQLLNIATENVNTCFSNPEIAAKIAENNRGRKHTAETLAKMSASLTGKKHTAETKAKMAAAKRGKKQDAETIAKRAASLMKPIYVKYQDGREATYPSRNATAEALGVSFSLMGIWVAGKSTSHTKPKYGCIAEIRYL